MTVGLSHKKACLIHFRDRVYQRLGIELTLAEVEKWVALLKRQWPKEWINQGGGRIKFRRSIGGVNVWVVYDTKKDVPVTVMYRVKA